MITCKEIKESFLHFIFPHICSGCGTDLLSEESQLCLRCTNAMPETNFELYPRNPVEKIFWGRLPVQSATAQFYFTKESLIQHLMHQFKYKKDKPLGFQLGRMMGEQLLRSGRFMIDALVPLPLFPAKEKRRGYNQAAVLCEGMSAILQVPVLQDLVTRSQYTESQTQKGRIERWKNVDGKFILDLKTVIDHTHLLLVDDVVTTGATLEACGMELLKAGNVQLSLAALCFATH